MILSCLVLVCALALFVQSKKKEPPTMKKDPFIYPPRFGVKVTDDYYYIDSWKGGPAWSYTLKEDGWAKSHYYDKRLNKVTKDDLNTYVKPFFESVNDLGGNIGGYYYYRTTGDFNQWKQEEIGKTGKTKTILDESVLYNSLGKVNYFRVDRVIPSPSGNFVAYSVDTLGSESYTVYIKDLTGTKETEKLENCVKGFVWSNDEKFFLYEQAGDFPTQAVKIMSHEIGTDPKNDFTVLSVNYTWELHLKVTSDTNYITITKKNYRDGCVVYYLSRDQYKKLDVTFSEFKINGFTEGAEYYVDHAPFGFVVQYQKSGSLSNFGVYEATLNGAAFDLGKTYLSENGERYIMRVDCTMNYVYAFVYLTERLYPMVFRINSTTPEKDTIRIPFAFDFQAIDFFFDDEYPILGTDLTKWMRDGQPTDNYQVRISNFVGSPSLHLHEPSLGRTRVVSVGKTIPEFKPSNYRLFQETTSRSYVNVTGFGLRNISVGVSWVGKTSKDEGKDGKKKKRFPCYKGNRPIILEVNTVYGDVIQPRFNPWMIPLLERGFQYGIIYARGCRNKGTFWHRLAQENRLYTQGDISAVINQLIDHKWIKDGSAVILTGKGAAAVGIVNLMISDRTLYNVTLLDSPLVSLFSKMLIEDEGALDRTEFGDVLNDEDQFKFWYKHDPYFWFTTAKANYPNFYMYGGIQDGRNVYGNAAKFMVQLRDWALQNDDTYIMRYDYRAGYLGLSPILDEKIERTSELHSFVVKTMQGYVWHDPLEWLWILLCIIFLACWMVCFMMFFICCEIRSKRKEKEREKKEAEKKKEEGEAEGEGEAGASQKSGYGTYASIEEETEHPGVVGVDGGVYQNEEVDEKKGEDSMVYADNVGGNMDYDGEGLMSNEGDGLPENITFDEGV